MRKHPQGIKILKQMCNLQLCEHIDDTLFIHTDPTKPIIDMILTHGIDNLNSLFQKNMRAWLLDGKPITTQPSFETLRDIFLNTGNRRGENDMTEQQARALQQGGINCIMHGHSNHGA